MVLGLLAGLLLGLVLPRGLLPPGRFRDLVSAVRTVGLGNVMIVHTSPS